LACAIFQLFIFYSSNLPDMFSSLFSVGLVLASSTLAYQIIDVTVGGPRGELVFNPEAVSAQPGDQVVYHFNPKNHTVTQSSFASPCGFKAGGIDSGFHPVMVNQTDNLPTFTVTVNDTNPVWIYCKQAADTVNSHCGQGMVHAINCGADGTQNSFTNFKAAALAVGASLSAAGSSTYTAAYGSATIPPPENPVVVTETITLQQSTWTTTYSSYPNSPEPTPNSLTGNVIQVIVGGDAGNVTFTPSRVSAQPRDIVMFQFQQKNHTVTQSSFSAPCLKLSNATTGQVGFDSGFMPVAAGATNFPTWNLTVNDTSPIWAYCRQAGHCGKGMVFAINSDESGARNFTAFQALAMQLNGTTTSSTSSGGSSPTGAVSSGDANGVGGGFVVAVAAAFLGLIL